MSKLTDKTIVDIKNPYLRKAVVIWAYLVSVLIYSICTPCLYVVNYMWPSLQEAGYDIRLALIELHVFMIEAWRGR